MAPPLLVLEAKVKLQGDKKSRELPIENFFLGPGETSLSPGEILSDILLDPAQPDTKALFLKKGRTRMDLAVASVAVLIRMEGRRCLKARVAAGSVAPITLRLTEVADLLEGGTLSPELLSEAQALACRCVSPISDVRSSADYRRHLLGVLLKRALEKLMKGESGKSIGREFEEENE
jgi:CO/xanthine dehydrogenase FAD-binding subunit